jgi:hypothetical protein
MYEAMLLQKHMEYMWQLDRLLSFVGPSFTTPRIPAVKKLWLPRLYLHEQ